MADRDILFRIGVTSHPDTQKRLSDLADSVKRTMQSVESSIVSVGNKAAETSRLISASGAGAQVGVSARGVAATASSSPASSSRVSGAGSLADAAGGSLASGDRLKGLRDELQESAKAAAALGSKLNGIPLTELIQRGDAFNQSLEDIDRQLTKVGSSQSKTFREMTGLVGQAGEGIGQLGQGLALLGADSSNIKKFVETLKTIKGVTDVFTGSTKILTTLTQGLSLFGERSELAGQKQSLLAERQRLVAVEGRELALAFKAQALAAEQSGTATEQQIRSLRRLAAELDHATRETNQLDAAQDSLRANPPPRGGGIVAPGFGGRSGGLLGRLAGAAGFSIAGSLTDSPLAQDLIGTGADALGDRLQGGGLRGLGRGLGRFGGIAGRAGGAVATIASAAALGKGVYDVAAGGGMLDDSSLSGRFFGGIGTSRSLANADRLFQRNSPFGRENDATRLADSYDAVDRAQARVDASRKRDQDGSLSRQYAAADLGVSQQLSDRRLSDLSSQRSFGVDSGRLSQLQSSRLGSAAEAKELEKSLSKVRDYQSGILTDETQYLTALERSQTVSERLATSQRDQQSALREEFSLRRELNSLGIQGIEARIGLISKEADGIRALGRTAEDSLLSSAEKFARLTDEQQKQAVQAQRIAQRGGQLTDKQQDLLSSIGTAGANDAVRRQNLAEARSKGFFQTFGGSEQQLAAAARQSSIQQQLAELSQARGKVGRSIREAQADGRISTEDRQRIAGARSSLAELTERQQSERRGEQSDRLRSLGFTDKANRQDARRLSALGGEQARLQVAVVNKQELNITLQQNEQAAVAAVQRVLAQNQRGQVERMTTLLQAGLLKTKTELRAEFEKSRQAGNQQGKNSLPS